MCTVPPILHKHNLNCSERGLVLSHNFYKLESLKKIAFHRFCTTASLHLHQKCSPNCEMPLFFKLYGICLTERWFVAGITLGEDGVLTIERVKKDDEGLYECIASNVEGVAKTSAVVTVVGKLFRHVEINLTMKKDQHFNVLHLQYWFLSVKWCVLQSVWLQITSNTLIISPNIGVIAFSAHPIKTSQRPSCPLFSCHHYK